MSDADLTANDALFEMLQSHHDGWKAGLERLRETGAERWSDDIWRQGDVESYDLYMRWVGALARAEGMTIEDTRAAIEADPPSESAARPLLQEQ